MALFIIALYFAAKYVYDTLLKIAAGCHDPFNPLYCYRDYPTWAKGYNSGRSHVLKVVKKILAEFEAENARILEKYHGYKDNEKHTAEDKPKAEPTK